VTTVTATAPGKLFLVGEYAVLAGAPALLLAVDRRATVTVAESSAWRLTAPELGIDALALGEDGALPTGLDAVARRSLVLFDAVRREVAAHTGGPGTPLDITIDTGPFLQDGHKLGLGSSAAVAVALTAALARVRGVELDRDTLFSLADPAHRDAQGGSGSGGDVAASTYGGRILYSRGSSPEPVGWPDDLGLFAVVTGTGSSTVDLVARVAEYGRRDPKGHRRDVDALAGLAATTPKALTGADAFLALADDYFRALDALDLHSGAGIVTERHRELRALAAASGAVFKTTGAGGGDLGLVFAKLEATDELQSAFADAGAAVTPVPHSLDGARIEAVA
jgi:mevalonate kinase